MIGRFCTDRRRFFASRSWWGFIACLTLENYVVFYIGAALWLCFIGSPGESRAGMVYAPTLAQLANQILWAPFLETTGFQFLIIEALRRLKWPTTWQLWTSVGIFTAAHCIGGGAAHGLLSGAIGGYYLAFTYVTYRERSLLWAFAMTLAFHSLHNGLTAVERVIKYR
jgi:hypothetical protein